MAKYPVLAALVGVVAIVGTAFAVSNRFIARATFIEFKDHIIYRLDTIDEKLSIIIQDRTK